MNETLSPPVERYLEALELELKKLNGISPEDALSDARELLDSDRQTLLRAEPGMGDEAIFAHFVETLGPPETMAAGFASLEDKGKAVVFGYAPGWRICCTKCGRSSPYGRYSIRIGSGSWQEYTWCYCRNCRHIRTFRIIKDANKANLTRQLGATRTPDDVRRKMHHPWLVVLGILAIIVLAVLASNLFVRGDPPPAEFRELPKGWSVRESANIPASQRDAIATRLGGRLDELVNTVLTRRGKPIQINTVRCPDEHSADVVEAALRQGKLNRRLVQRRGNTIYEFVARNQSDLFLALEARYELGIQPRRVTYSVRFDAAPLRNADWMKWNQMFDLFLQMEHGDNSAATRSQIAELSSSFEFDDELTLRRFGQGKTESTWSFVPAAASSQPTADGNSTVYRFGKLPQKAGVDYVSVSGTVTSETYAPTPVVDADAEAYLAATPAWPVGDPAVVKLAKQITEGHDSVRSKVTAILHWLAPDTNIRFGGDVVGSRYGVSQVLEQRFGHCWDFSDVFVTLCRTSGVPCRQVFGWLSGDEGHVWAEVLLEDSGWLAVDPTAAGSCGSDYVPFVSSSDGNMPLLYMSNVKIDVIESPGQ